MRLNGKRPEDMHKALGVAAEVIPRFAAREISTVEMGAGNVITRVSYKPDEYIVRVNVAASTYAEAMEARMALAEWANAAAEETAKAEPTHLHGKVYNVVLDKISPVEKRFDVCDVVFMVPDPFLYDAGLSAATGKGGKLVLYYQGTHPVEPVLTVTLDEAAEGLTLSEDGTAFFTLHGALEKGSTVEINMQTAAVLVNGQHAENRISYTGTNVDKCFRQGRHEIISSVSAAMTARWTNTWR